MDISRVVIRTTYRIGEEVGHLWLWRNWRDTMVVICGDNYCI